MASGLIRFQNSLSAKVIPCIKQTTISSNHLNSRCRTVMSIAFNAGYAEDTVPIDKQKSSIKRHEALSLKEKEKGDWRNLTFEEKDVVFSIGYPVPSHWMAFTVGFYLPSTAIQFALSKILHLYRMRFSQPFSEIIDQPADEWKLILASTFAAMGLMTLGLYFWMSRKVEPTELFSGPISFQTEVTEEEKISHKMKRMDSEM